MSTQARRPYLRRFRRRSNRSRAQDLRRQARTVVSASGRSKREKRLLARWMRRPNMLDVKGVDTRRRRVMPMRSRKRKAMRPPSPAPARRTRQTGPTGLGPRRRRTRRPSVRPHLGSATRRVKAQALRELRKTRPHLTADAYRQSQIVMRDILKMYQDESPKRVTPRQYNEAVQTVRQHFFREMKKRHPDFSETWGRRQSVGRQRRMRL